jgi:hypothetical protein
MIPINALNQLPPETLEYTFIKPKSPQPNPLSFDLLQINLDTDLAFKIETKTFFKNQSMLKTLNNKLKTNLPGIAFNNSRFITIKPKVRFFK